MKRMDKKSDCAINYSLENIGDSWSLLLIRDIVYYGKKTFGEFLASDERIGTNTLTRRLVALEKKGILTKQVHRKDKRKEIYLLTEKGMGLIPILLDLAEWGAQNDPETGADLTMITKIRAHREKVIALTLETVKKGRSMVVGPNNVLKQLI